MLYIEHKIQLTYPVIPDESATTRQSQSWSLGRITMRMLMWSKNLTNLIHTALGEMFSIDHSTLDGRQTVSNINNVPLKNLHVSLCGFHYIPDSLNCSSKILFFFLKRNTLCNEVHQALTILRRHRLPASENCLPQLGQTPNYIKVLVNLLASQAPGVYSPETRW